MKIVVADKISPHGVKLFSDLGWQVSQPAANALAAELADADALVVRSATRVTDELLDPSAARARGGTRRRGRGQYRSGCRDAPRRRGHEHARRKFRERRGTRAGADAGAGPFHSAAERRAARRPLGESPARRAPNCAAKHSVWSGWAAWARRSRAGRAASRCAWWRTILT